MPEPKRSETKHEPMRIGLLGASFDTGNMGVSALAESTIKCILHRWPDAEITLLGGGYRPHEHCFLLTGKEICVRVLPVRFSKNIFLPYHFLWFVSYGLLSKLLPRSRLKEALVNRNEYFRSLCETGLVVDITAGDSFSDIYGFKRFFLGFLRKCLVIFLKKKLVLFPQTYGPFKGNIARAMARYVLRRAGAIYSRDRDSLEYVKDLLGSNREDGKIQFVPDVAFVLDSRKPDNFGASPLSKIAKGSTVVGVNVSGLLFNGGYTRDNMFGLKTEYRPLIYAVIEMLLKNKKVAVLLVPHVFPPVGCEVESDPDACLKVYEQLKQIYSDRIFLLEGEYDQGEIKYVIGLCDFFVGSRMHACIAALSQSIPAVGIAYSKKFYGVFESIGLTECVADARTLEKEQILKIVRSVFRERDKTRRHLESTVPNVTKEILNILWVNN